MTNEPKEYRNIEAGKVEPVPELVEQDRLLAEIRASAATVVDEAGNLREPASQPNPVGTPIGDLLDVVPVALWDLYQNGMDLLANMHDIARLNAETAARIATEQDDLDAITAGIRLTVEGKNEAERNASVLLQVQSSEDATRITQHIRDWREDIALGNAKLETHRLRVRLIQSVINAFGGNR